MGKEKLRAKQLGETWLISGVLVSGSDAEVEALVEGAWQNIFGTKDKPAEEAQWRESGDFLGGKLFEFFSLYSPETSEPSSEAHTSRESRHLLAIFYPDEAAAEAGDRLYDSYLIRLLFYRHKITWAYQNARDLKQQVLKTYNELSAIADFSRVELSQLERDMETLYKFTKNLSYLEVQHPTTEINLNNYKITLDEVSKQARETGKTDLDFMSEFAETIIKGEYMKQIEADAASLRPALAVLENLIATIRGTVEIRQARSDRTFQTVVGVVGVGLGTGGMVASASSSFEKHIHIQEIPGFSPLINSKLLPLEPGSGLRTVLVFSIVSGIVAGAATWLVIFLWQQIIDWRRSQ